MELLALDAAGLVALFVVLVLDVSGLILRPKPLSFFLVTDGDAFSDRSDVDDNRLLSSRMVGTAIELRLCLKAAVLGSRLFAAGWASPLVLRESAGALPIIAKPGPSLLLGLRIKGSPKSFAIMDRLGVTFAAEKTFESLTRLPCVGVLGVETPTVSEV